jgi:hypothetical protein
MSDMATPEQLSAWAQDPTFCFANLEWACVRRSYGTMQGKQTRCGAGRVERQRGYNHMRTSFTIIRAAWVEVLASLQKMVPATTPLGVRMASAIAEKPVGRLPSPPICPPSSA